MIEINQKHWLYLILIALVIMSAIIVFPYLSPLLFAAALAYICYPLQKRLSKKIRKSFSALIVTSILFSLMIVFVLYGITFMINRIFDITSLISTSGLSSTVMNLGIGDLLNQITSKVSTYIFSMTSEIPGYVISLFIFFVSFYYFLIRGPEIYKFAKDILPIAKNKKDKIFLDIKRQVNAIVYVQFMIGIAQGIIGGLGLFIFGYEYFILGGIIMGILGFIPVIGPPLFYIPVGALSLAQGNVFAGVGIILFGLFIVSTVDNLIRPFLMGRKAKVHPLVVIVGLFGGILVFGVAGILVGPILLSITLTFIKDLEKFKIIE